VGIGMFAAIGYLLGASWLGMDEPRTLVRLAVDRLFRGRPAGGAQ
jgi:hypothetical protein